MRASVCVSICKFTHGLASWPVVVVVVWVFVCDVASLDYGLFDHEMHAAMRI